MNSGPAMAGRAFVPDVRDRAGLARALTLIERGDETSQAFLARLRPSGRAIRIGITGAPGAGKSTLTMQLVRALRPSGTVGVIAVDPSSPFSGGALLGDRVRMNDVAGDDGVFIRSMAARGALGGLSAAVADAADVLEAAGFDHVLIETVGVGQGELDVARIADTTLVVVTPESGDEVQAAKAGLMEIADVFVLNKDDRPDGNALSNALRRMIDARSRVARDAWAPPIVRTVASSGRGIDELAGAIARHRDHLRHEGRLAARRHARDRERLVALTTARLVHRLQTDEWQARIDAALGAVDAGGTSLHAAAGALARSFAAGSLHTDTPRGDPMSLADQLNAFKSGFLEKVPEEIQARMRASESRIAAEVGTTRCRRAGDTAPGFELPNARNERVALQALLARGPVVVSFYRGGWCPYCNIELKGLQDRLADIQAAGGTLVAISPELPEISQDTVARNGLRFEVLSDLGNRVAAAYGLDFVLDADLRPIYRNWGADVAARNGDDSYRLPMPATFVVETGGRIAEAFVDVDYTRRLEPDRIVAVLRGLGPRAQHSATAWESTPP
jgi:LAO/AO transport system kinase